MQGTGEGNSLNFGKMRSQLSCVVPLESTQSPLEQDEGLSKEAFKENNRTHGLYVYHHGEQL